MTMQIRNQKIAGFSAVKVRNALRHIGAADHFDADSIFAEYLHIEDNEKITKALLGSGYIEPTTPKFAWEDKRKRWYALTEKGRSFVSASGMVRMPRTKGDGILKGVLERINEVNEGPYAFTVSRVVVFGSFLRQTEETLGDVDIAIELTSRYSDEHQRRRAEDERIRIAEQNGRRFSNIALRYYWPQEEVLKHLKSGQRYLSLHSMRELFDMAQQGNSPIPHRVIFGRPVVFPAVPAESS